MPSDADFLPMASPFDVVRRGGYDSAQVDDWLARADADLRVTAADRDAAASQAAERASQLDAARAEIEALQSQVDRLALVPQDTEGLSDRMQRMLRLAQDEASEIRARAEADAAEVRSVAEQETEAERVELAQRLTEAERRREEQESEHTTTMSAARARAQELTEAAEAERDRLDAESLAVRSGVEEDFELAMNSRRSEALAALQHDETTSKAEAERRVRDATTEAQRRLQRATEQSEARTTAATARVRELTALRARVADQLSVVQQTLETVPAALAPLEEETTTDDEAVRTTDG